ncbi:AfsR/SARP family transcriptional regulator, partial [Virgisporangium aurantiacum]|uniref:AfsR/SARP family transcriptional regulator n=1 Tax=Virgisporangium aurantiacum TaxID=175570 RepID=UPI0023B268B1
WPRTAAPPPANNEPGRSAGDPTAIDFDTDFDADPDTGFDADFDPLDDPDDDPNEVDDERAGRSDSGGPATTDPYVTDLVDGDAAEGSGEIDESDEPGQVSAWEQMPAVPALASPGMAVWPAAGLGLIGPRAADAARGFLTAALAAGSTATSADTPEVRTHVVMPATTAAALLGPAAVGLPAMPRLTITASLDDALDLLEAQILHRTRLVYRHEVATVTDLRAADPLEEPVEPMLLITNTGTGTSDGAATDHVRTRIAAVLSQGDRLDIHGIFLGTWPDGTTVVVNADGTTQPHGGDRGPNGYHPGGAGHHAADIGRLAVLTAAETVDLLALLAESHTDQPPTPASLPTTCEPTDPQPTDERLPGPAAATDPTPNPTPVPAGPPTLGPGAGPVDDQPDTRTPGDARAAVRIRVLGPPEIIDMDTAKGPPRGKSMELLVYLAAHDGPVHYETIIDDLLPDAPARSAPHRLHTYVSDLRQVLRRTGGTGDYVLRSGPRYRLSRDLLDVDLWRMQQALRDAEQATDPAAKVAAWRHGVAEYRRELADGTSYEWIEPYREAARLQVLDAALALADALADRPTEALAVLDAALAHSPYTEALYQAAMRAHATRNDVEAIRRLRRTLNLRLAEIDAEPTEETTALANELITRLQPPLRRTRPRPAAGPDTDTHR